MEPVRPGRGFGAPYESHGLGGLRRPLRGVGGILWLVVERDDRHGQPDGFHPDHLLSNSSSRSGVPSPFLGEVLLNGVQRSLKDLPGKELLPLGNAVTITVESGRPFHE